MRNRICKLNAAVAALAAFWLVSALALASAPVAAEQARLDTLYAELREAGPEEARRLSREIELELAQSGSPAMDLLLRRGNEAMEEGALREAIGHFSALIDHAPDHAEAYYLRALAYFQQDHYGLAAADIGQVLRRNPKHYGALFGLGLILEETGKPAEAQKAYEAALEIHPHFKEAKAALARVGQMNRGKDI